MEDGAPPVNRGRAGKGRPPGSPNKTTAAIKEMVTQAIEKAGGAEYLFRQSSENPVAFMGLVGKVLPLQIAGEGKDGSINITIKRFDA